MGRDISRLHPRLQGKVAQLQKACEKAGLALGIGESSAPRRSRTPYTPRENQPRSHCHQRSRQQLFQPASVGDRF